MAAPFPFHPWTTDLAVKEDGRRVALVDSTFEWWYFDTIMDDGSTCAVNFLSKRPFLPGPTAPILQFNIGTPSGKYLQSEASLPANTYSAATDHCDVAMGKSWVKGDLHAYTIHAEGVAEGSGTADAGRPDFAARGSRVALRAVPHARGSRNPMAG